MFTVQTLKTVPSAPPLKRAPRRARGRGAGGSQSTASLSLSLISRDRVPPACCAVTCVRARQFLSFAWPVPDLVVGRTLSTSAWLCRTLVTRRVWRLATHTWTLYRPAEAVRRLRRGANASNLKTNA